MMTEVEQRGVDLATGHGREIWDLNPVLGAKVNSLYDDAKKSLWTELTPGFIDAVPNVLPVRTQSKDREDYITHPPTGEILDPESLAAIVRLRDSWGANVPKAQIVISDGLNANAIMDKGHLEPYLVEMRRLLREAGVTVADKNILVTERTGPCRLPDRRDAFRRREPQQFQRCPPHHRRTAWNGASRLFGLHNGGTGQHLGAEEDRS